MMTQSLDANILDFGATCMLAAKASSTAGNIVATGIAGIVTAGIVSAIVIVAIIAVLIYKKCKRDKSNEAVAEPISPVDR